MDGYEGESMGDTGKNGWLNQGFTLIELMVVVLVSSIVVMAVFSYFDFNSRAFKTNDRVVGLIQSIRVSLTLIEQDITMAGFDPMANDPRDPYPKSIPRPGFLEARPGGFQVTMNLNADGQVTGPAENVSYRLAGDSNCDGVPDSGGLGSLERSLGGNFEPVVDGIEAIRFAYAYDFEDVGNPGGGVLEFDDLNGDGIAEEDEIIWAYDTTNDGILDTDINGNSVRVPLEKIRAVRIWILVRTDKDTGFMKHTDNRVYPMGGIIRDYSGNKQDHFYRRFQVATIRCRNLGTAFRRL